MDSESHQSAATAAFIREYTGGQADLERLTGDASTREYWRVRRGPRSWILCRDESLAVNDLAAHPFMVVHALLAGRVPVPALYGVDASCGLLLLQDLGDELLEYHVMNVGAASARAVYETALRHLVAIQSLHSTGRPPFTLAFDVEKLLFEFDFFISHFLVGWLGVDPGDASLSSLREEFRSIAALLVRPDDFVLNHRDYQSRNLMVHDGGLWIIDFQDARRGLPQYDVVSLLRDPYVVLDNESFGHLVDYYYDASFAAGIHRQNRVTFDALFDLMAFQRNIKALGTYGYQSGVRGIARFEGYMAAAASYLPDYAVRRPELRPAWRILAPLLALMPGPPR